MSKVQKRRGRPKQQDKEPMKQLAIRFPDELLHEIDAMIAGRLDRPDRASIIRELINEAITARKKAKG